jgi:hypothetical protein
MLSTVSQLCTKAVAHFESVLESQIEFNQTQARRIKDEERKQVELTKQVAEQEEMEKLEKIREREREKQEIEAVEHELAVKKNALLQAEKGDDNNDNASQSAMDDHIVSNQTTMSYEDDIDHNNCVRSPPRKEQSEM